MKINEGLTKSDDKRYNITRGPEIFNQAFRSSAHQYHIVFVSLTMLLKKARVFRLCCVSLSFIILVQNGSMGEVQGGFFLSSTTFTNFITGVKIPLRQYQEPLVATFLKFGNVSFPRVSFLCLMVSHKKTQEYGYNSNKESDSCILEWEIFHPM